MAVAPASGAEGGARLAMALEWLRILVWPDTEKTTIASAGEAI